MPESHNHAIIGGGIAGISAAWELLAHGRGIGNPSGGDIQVSLFEQQPLEQLFDRKAAKRADHYPSSSVYGARNIRLMGEHNQVDALKIKASADLYKKVHALAIEHGVYDDLIAQGYTHLKHEPVVQGQAAIEICNSNDLESNRRLDKQKASIFVGTQMPPRETTKASLEDNNVTFADIIPPVKQRIIYATPFADALENYRQQLQSFCEQYPRPGQAMLEQYGLTELISQPLDAWLAQGYGDDKKPLPRILVEKAWTQKHPERAALSLNSNSFMLVSLALMQKLYPEQFHMYAGTEIKAYHSLEDGVALTFEDDKQVQYDDVLLAAGPFMQESVEKAGIDIDVTANPYIEFRLPGSQFSAQGIPVLRGEALPANRQFMIDLGNGKTMPLTISTISRNGAYIKDGEKQAELFKVQFKEKLPLEHASDITQLPSLDLVAPQIAQAVAQSYGISLDAHTLDHAKGRWCPQAQGKQRASGKVTMFSGPVTPVNVIEKTDGELDISQTSPIYILGPGNAAGAQFLGGKADLVVSMMQERKHRMYEYGISNQEAYGVSVPIQPPHLPDTEINSGSSTLFGRLFNKALKLIGLD